MTIPSRPIPNSPAITSATDIGDFYEAVLQDGTIMWIPKDVNNNDCLQIQAWADAANIDL